MDEYWMEFGGDDQTPADEGQGGEMFAPGGLDFQPGGGLTPEGLNGDDAHAFALDVDGDGLPDALTVQGEEGQYIVAGLDADGDGVADDVFLFEDADGDGAVDNAYAFEEESGEEAVDAKAADEEEAGEEEEADAGDSDDKDDWAGEGQWAAPDGAPSELPPELDVPNFDPAQGGEAVVGDPASDMEVWHQQTYPDTCAIASQEFILDTLTGLDFSEDELRQQAIDNGWYTPGGGTPLEDMGKLLEANGVEVERGHGFTLDDLGERLEQGSKVMVAVDSDEIWTPGQDDDESFMSLLTYPGIPGQDANHAVEVIGIDRSDPSNPIVVLNDPGHPDGQGMLVPAGEFVDAWADSDNYMVATV